MWAFKRNVFKKCKLPEFAICGGGDVIFSSYLINSLPNLLENRKCYINNCYEKYITNFDPSWTISYLNLTIYHLFHSSLENRQYGNRDDRMNQLLKSKNINQLSDVFEYNEEGIIKWKDEYRDEFNQHMLEFFLNRKDDSL